MHPNIQHLIDLQVVDLRLAQLRAQLAGFPRRLAELDSRLAAARKQLETSKEALLTSLKDRKKYELDAEQWKEKVRKYKDQSGSVKTNEAYKALQHEIAHAEGEVAKAEDRLLDRMMAGEEFERQVKAAERSLKEIEATASAERQQLQKEQSALQKELEVDEARRREATAFIPEDLLDHYHRIASRHGGVGLAAVRDETCSMCRVRVRPHVFQKLRREGCEEVFHCETCTRILYYFEPIAQAAAAAESSAPTDES